jgi:hypothetical protein
MERDLRGPHSSRRSILGALAWFRGVAAWAAIAAFGAVIAIVVAAGVVAIALPASALLAMGSALRSRRASPPGDPDLLEARRVGGHSWVAYAADARR